MEETQAVSSFWIWLSLAAFFLVVEVVLVPSGFFLCLATASALVALVAFFAPAISWMDMFLVFSGVMVVSSYFWLRVLRDKRQNKKMDEADMLGSRQDRLVGTVLVLDADLSGGKGRVKINDATWPVEADEDFPAGTKVRIGAINGITLHLEKH